MKIKNIQIFILFSCLLKLEAETSKELVYLFTHLVRVQQI